LSHIVYSVPITSKLRLYYKPEKDQNGFSFYGVELTGVFEPYEDWVPEITIVECFFKGQAFFDGIRHLYMGADYTDNYGYHYYPDMQD